MNNHAIPFLYLSQEDLINGGAFDMSMAIRATQNSIRLYHDGHILFPEKIVQEFDEVYKDRINCLPATLLDEKICGVKWVSVFPRNPQLYGTQNLSAIIVLSHIEKGYPVCVMDGTLCSNMRVAAIGATAAQSGGGNFQCQGGYGTSGCTGNRRNRFHRCGRAGKNASAWHEGSSPESEGLPCGGQIPP